jgi:hypothetical protein
MRLGPGAPIWCGGADRSRSGAGRRLPCATGPGMNGRAVPWNRPAATRWLRGQLVTDGGSKGRLLVA